MIVLIVTDNIMKNESFYYKNIRVIKHEKNYLGFV